MSVSKLTANAFGVAALVSLLSGCAGSALTPTQGSYSPQQADMTATMSRHSNLDAGSRQRGPVLFVADIGVGSLGAVDRIKRRSGKPLPALTNGVHWPLGAFVDSKHNLYVANARGNNVSEYPRGATSPSFTYSTGLSFPEQVAVDKHGNVYVASTIPAGNGAIVEFAQGSNTVVAQCPASYYEKTEGIAVDKQGNVFVGLNHFPDGGRIIEYVGGLSHCNPTFLPVALGPYSYPIGVALDDKQNLIVSTEISIELIPPPYSSVTATLGSYSSSQVPLGISLARNNKTLYVAVYQGFGGDSFIDALSYPDGKSIAHFTNGVTTPESVAVDPDAVY